MAGAQLKARVARVPAPAERRSRKSELGQFFTPTSIAAFMAGMFPDQALKDLHLLDAGAGQGALSSAVLQRIPQMKRRTTEVSVTAYECDEEVLPHLNRTLSLFENANVRVVPGDFIEHAVKDIKNETFPQFSHAVLNPPYKKISSSSRHRALLREVGIETVNLYSAFVALSLLRVRSGGYLCAIIPRSFCNGPYYRRFREMLLSKGALCRVHLFGARDKAFAEDAVLQENVIILVQRNGVQRDVEISFSTDDTFSDLTMHTVAFNQVVKPRDSDRMIHLQHVEANSALLEKFDTSLAELNVQVSTGPVVDFRLKEHLRRIPGSGTVPLIYPGHFGATGYSWPYGNGKKPSAIAKNSQTDKWLFPSGNYTVVRRLSSKEERRRIIANVVPRSAIGTPKIGFENHLNVFHRNKKGLSKHLALGLMAYLNSSMIDVHFRAFNGHTQVNATDLRSLPYPNEETLLRLGRWAAAVKTPSQSMIDAYLEKMV